MSESTSIARVVVTSSLAADRAAREGHKEDSSSIMRGFEESLESELEEGDCVAPPLDYRWHD